MSERSKGRERSEQSGASKRVSGVRERMNGRASGPVLSSLFSFVPDHSAAWLHIIHARAQTKKQAVRPDLNDVPTF